MAPTAPTDASRATAQTQPSAPAPAPAPAPPSGDTQQQQQQQLPAGLPDIVRNDPARTGFDPKTAWWVNLFHIMTGKVNEEGVFHYREWQSRVHEARNCARCEEWRDWCLRNSPTVIFMRQKIRDLGGELDRDNIVCRRCPARLTADGAVHRQSGGFSPAHGVLICANGVRDRSHLEDSLAHEMVHAWDTLRWKIDWLGDHDLRHAACTEVSRAALPSEQKKRKKKG